MISDVMPVKEALLLEEDLTRTGRVVSYQFFDGDDDSWTKKELLAFLKEMETEPHDLIAYIDGGYNKETRDAGLGIALYYKQNGQRWRYRVNERIESIENNNEAEFAALAYLLTICEELGIHHQPITIHTDSKTLYHQINGEWPSYEQTLTRWLDRIESNTTRLGIKADYKLLPRHENKEADQLASQALQNILISGKKEQAKTK